MTTLINAIDNTSNRLEGENGHYMESWSNKIEEKIVQYYSFVYYKIKGVLNWYPYFILLKHFSMYIWLFFN